MARNEQRAIDDLSTFEIESFIAADGVPGIELVWPGVARTRMSTKSGFMLGVALIAASRAARNHKEGSFDPSQADAETFEAILACGVVGYLAANQAAEEQTKDAP